MAIVIKIRRAAKENPGRSTNNNLWLGYIGGKLLPLVYQCDGGASIEAVLPDARDLYPELRLNLTVIEGALELLCENDFAKRDFKPIPEKPDRKTCHYLLTSKGMTMLALLADQPGLYVKITD